MKKIASTILSLIFVSMIAQQLEINFSEKKTVNIASPNVQNLLRIDSYPNISSVGGTEITVPIYNINFTGLEIPIKLVYNSKGIKVSDIASNVGLGWSLVTGGYISEQTNDLPDFDSRDEYFDPTGQGTFEQDLGNRWNRVSKGYHVGYYSIEPIPSFVDYYKDSSPDFYSVNAPGLNDSFFLKKLLDKCPNNDCEHDLFLAQFISGIKYKSDSIRIGESNIINPIYQNPTTAPKLPTLRNLNITNLNGYKYSFNEPQATMTIIEPGEGRDWLQFPKINFWQISKIESPNSKSKIEFHYTNLNNSYKDYRLLRDKIISFDFGNVKFDRGLAPDVNKNHTITTIVNKKVYSQITGEKRISKIDFPQGSVNFIYNFARNDFEGTALSKIFIVDKSDKLIKEIYFNYSYFLPKSSDCNDAFKCLRLRLDSITDSNNETHSFGYGLNNSNYVFPDRSSSKVDFTGYFNNNSSDLKIFTGNQIPLNYNYYPKDKIYYYPLLKDKLLPFKLKNNSYFEVDGSIDRTPNENSLIGLLSKIKYPTGGQLKIEYENDVFNYEGEDYLLGSARIKKLSLEGDDFVKNAVTFKYLNENGKSSGLINNFVPPSDYFLTSGTTGLEYNADSYVVYSRVIEETLGKGTKQSYYSNIDSYPDISEKINFDNWSDRPYNVLFLKAFKYPNIIIQKMNLRRGNLLKELLFNNEGILVKKIQNQYLYKVKDSVILAKEFSSYASQFNNGNRNDIATNVLRIHSNKISKSEETTFFGENFIKTDKILFYDQDNDIVKKEIVSSLGNSTETTYRYASDFANYYLIDKNILGVPIEIELKKNSKIVSKEKIVYPISETDANNSTSGFPLPKALLSYNLQDLNNASVSNQIPYTEIAYTSYDNSGNIQEYQNRVEIPTAIILGYNQTQPIAKIEGAKLSDIPQGLITAIVNASDYSSQSYSEAALLTQLDSFRTVLPNFQISTYTYKPLIGVSTITPPSGIREIYKYDTANRLQSVKDVNGKILKEYQYNYKQP